MLAVSQNVMPRSSARWKIGAASSWPRIQVMRPASLSPKLMQPRASRLTSSPEDPSRVYSTLPPVALRTRGVRPSSSQCDLAIMVQEGAGTEDWGHAVGYRDPGPRGRHDAAGTEPGPDAGGGGGRRGGAASARQDAQVPGG